MSRSIEGQPPQTLTQRQVAELAAQRGDRGPFGLLNIHYSPVATNPLRPQDYPDARDRRDVNDISEAARPGVWQRWTSSGTARAVALGGVLAAAAVGLAFTLDSDDAHADGDPIPNPDYIPNDEEPDPDGPPVVPVPSSTPQAQPTPELPPQDNHEEFYQVVHKEMFDLNGNRIPEWGVDAPWDMQFRYWEDFNRNGQPDAGEGLQSNLRTGPDGVEVIKDSIIGDVKDVSICLEDTNVDPNVQLVTPQVQCADINPASKTVEIQSLVENKQVTPPSATPGPTPKPTETPGPTPSSTPAVLPPAGGPTPKVEVTPPAGPGPQPLVCPPEFELAGGVALPPEFVGAPAFEIEAKCELIDHDLRQTEQHEEIIEVMTEQHGEQNVILNDIENDVDLLLKRAREYAKQSSEEHADLGKQIGELPGLIEENGGDGLKLWQGLLIGAAGGAGLGGVILGGRLAAIRRKGKRTAP